MSSKRRTALAVGVLFFIATATYITASGLVTAAIRTPDDLASVNPTQLRVGVFLEFIDAAAAVAIAVLLLPILRQFSEAIGFAYAASRIVDSVLIVVSALGGLLLVPL